MREALTVAAATMLALAFVAAFAVVASAHEEGVSDAELAAGSEAHAEADGLTSSYDAARKSAVATARAKKTAQKRWKKYAEDNGLVLLSDREIRERVLMQSLGMPMNSLDGSGGYASATGDMPVARDGGEITAPDSEQLARATLSRGSASTFAANNGGNPAEYGEWSDPVTPQYDTFDAYNASTDPEQDGFPNPNYDGIDNIQFPGDPIINTSADYDADPANPNTPTANSRYWSPNPRIIPIFEAMLPNGQVIYWDWYFSGNMTDPDQEVDHKKGTRVLLWDPARAEEPGYKGIRKDVPGANLFCAGFQQLPNGDLLLAGGNANVALAGLKTTFVYHWRTGTWDQSQDMSRIRWYPSVATMWNGESMIVGGDPEEEGGNPAVGQTGYGVPEVFTSNYLSGSLDANLNPTNAQTWDKVNPTDKIRRLGSLANFYGDHSKPSVPAWRLYPFIFPWVDGRLLYAGRETDVLTVDPRRHNDGGDDAGYDPESDVDDSDDGGDRYIVQRADGANPITRTYGTGAYYAPGKVLVTGGDVDKLYCFTVPAANRGPGWPGTNIAPTVACPDGDVTPVGANPYAGGNQNGPGDADPNWVCKGFAGGNPYKYDGNGNWIGSADLTEVWNIDWCVGNNTPAIDTGGNNNHLHNGSSKQSALITARTTVGDANRWTGDTETAYQGWPTSSQAASMHYPRRMANLTILPTGKLLASGGMSTTNANDDEINSEQMTDALTNDTADGEAMDGNDANVNQTLVNYKRAVFAAEQWDPDTNSWKLLANLHRPRQYHSTAILLADGRVMSGGGGVCSTCTTAGYSQANFEFYSPPYLFKSNGERRTNAERPQITGPTHPDGSGENEGSFLPATEYDTDLTLSYTQAAGGVPLKKAVLIKQGAPTHGFDQSQRFVPVDLTVNSSTSAKIHTPANPYEAPPGYYWLFLIDENGTPSVAKAVQIGASLSLENKLRTARGFRQSDLSDPDPVNNGTSQDFGLGAYRASKGNLTDIGDDELSSFKLDAGFFADLCRGDDFSDCIRIPASTYTQLGTRWQDHVSSLRIQRLVLQSGETNLQANQRVGATGANAAALLDMSPDTTPPTISTTLNGASIDAGSVALTYSVVDDVSETDAHQAGGKITCDRPSGQVVSLAVGVNSFMITCTDGAGNTGSLTVLIAHQAPLLPPSTGGETPPAPKKLKLSVSKKTKLKTKLKFKTTCTETCLVTIGITGSGVNYWPKGVTLKGSSSKKTVTFKLKKSVYKQIGAAVKRKKKVKIRAWINDVIQGKGYFKR